MKTEETQRRSHKINRHRSKIWRYCMKTCAHTRARSHTRTHEHIEQIYSLLFCLKIVSFNTESCKNCHLYVKATIILQLGHLIKTVQSVSKSRTLEKVTKFEFCQTLFDFIIAFIVSKLVGVFSESRSIFMRISQTIHSR